MMVMVNPKPTTMIIFGATGDLTQRKLLPALYRLKTLKLLPEVFNVVGLSTRAIGDGEFRTMAAESIKSLPPPQKRPVDMEAVGSLTERMWFVSSSFDNP